ncbi:MAG: exodeoxyribonuclease V subunit gamma [Balneolaceae bacterium]|nr:exodeoxyribonuclease V subunit gamma [Balneolaceae bacterium]
MLKVYTGTQLQILAEALLDEFRHTPPQNPLVPELFVVQNYGVARWLSLHIAEKEGIAANLQFKFPAEVFWHVLRTMDSDIPENLPSERWPMTWAIFDILRSGVKESLPVLHRYIESDDSQKQEIRCWNLATRIADVFDQYLTYRPKMLRGWEQDSVVYKTTDSSEQWQAKLWRKLIQHWHGKNKREWNHRAELQNQLIKEFNDQAISINELPPRISVFGVTEMPKPYLEVFLKLSENIDVHFYLMNISENCDNMLINSLGKSGRSFKKRIKDHVKSSRIANEWIQVEQKSQPPNERLFDVLKNDLIRNNATNRHVGLDNSIQVHSCHSARREVEVLYDQLLNLLNEDTSLEASDILVVSPQMEEYAPTVDAVFGAPEQGMPEIPYHLTDSTGSAHLINIGFKKLLDIVDSRFKVTDVMDLLDFEPVRDAFSFSEDDVNMLERWIEGNNIRWGIDGDHKTELGLPRSNSFTWRSGLYRMMSGYAMDSTKDSLFNNIYPFDEIQKADDARLLGNFSHLLNCLFHWHEKTEESLSPEEWSNLLIGWLSQFFSEKEAHYHQVQWLREQLGRVGEQANRAGFDRTVSFRIFKKHVFDLIDQKSTGGGRAGAGVTFSSLVQMHSIPAKVICMIGMDDGVFPSAKAKSEFDLIAKYPEEGDRLPRRDDRQLFLETMLAAEKVLYFSFVGQSNKKEVEFPPSVVLREVIDYIADQYKIDVDKLIQKHRLHAFSTKYFEKNDDRLFSFSSKNRKVAEQLLGSDTSEGAFIDQPLPEPDKSFRQLSAGELISFFQHPARFFLQQRLGIYLGTETVPDEDREMFTLDGLGKYSIGQELLDRYLQDKPLHLHRQLIFAQDRLPENWPGNQIFEKEMEQVRQFGSLIKERFNQKKLEPVEIEIEIDDFHLFGRLDQVYEQEQLFYRFGKLRAKDRIELWIKHLLFQIERPDNHSGTTRLFTFEGHESVEVTVLPSLANSHKLLTSLLNYYWMGLQKSINFFPESSFAYAEMLSREGKDKEDAMKAAERKWINNYSYINEGKDAYNRCLIGSIKSLEDSYIEEKFKNISTSFWNPFLKVLNKEEEGTG